MLSGVGVRDPTEATVQSPPGQLLQLLHVPQDPKQVEPQDEHGEQAVHDEQVVQGEQHVLNDEQQLPHAEGAYAA